MDLWKYCQMCLIYLLELCLDTETMTLADLVERVFKRRLGFTNPMVTIQQSTIVYEEGEDADERLAINLGKRLKGLPGGGVKSGTSVEVDDLDQNLAVTLSVFHKTFDEEEKATMAKAMMTS